MEFKFYNPESLLSILRERGITSNYQVCQGCVLAGIAPEDCFHPKEEFQTPDIQSDSFCLHCYDTIEDTGERFNLSEDKDLGQKVCELEEILNMV